MTVAGVKTIFKRREKGERIFIICFATIFILSKGIDSGSAGLSYMFYRLQYKVKATDYSNLSTLYTVLMFLCQVCAQILLSQQYTAHCVFQVAVVPFMSSVLKWRDTTILMVAVFCAILGQFATALFMQMWVLYVCYVLFMLWNTITTTCRSNMSKLMESQEIGKAFSFLAIFQGILPFATKPFFAFLYKHTWDSFPGAYRILIGSFYIIVLIIIVLTHFGLKRLEKKNIREEKEGEGDGLNRPKLELE